MFKQWNIYNVRLLFNFGNNNTKTMCTVIAITADFSSKDYFVLKSLVNVSIWLRFNKIIRLKHAREPTIFEIKFPT